MACKYAHSNSGSSIVSSSKSVFPGRPSITERMGIFQGLNEIFQSDLFLINEARYYRIEWGGSVLKLMNGISLNWYRFFLPSSRGFCHLFLFDFTVLVLPRTPSCSSDEHRWRRLPSRFTFGASSTSSSSSSRFIILSFLFSSFVSFPFFSVIFFSHPDLRATAPLPSDCESGRAVQLFALKKRKKNTKKKSQSQKKVNDKKEPTLATFLEISHS